MTVFCQTGETLVGGGGYMISGTTGSLGLRGSGPTDAAGEYLTSTGTTARGWRIEPESPNSATYRIYALCSS